MIALSEGARALSKEPSYASIATVMPDGSPHVSPVWIDVDDEGRLLVNTVLGRRKEKNMRRDPRVALAVAAHDDPERRIEIRGRVVAWVDGDAAEQHIDQLSARYYGYEPYPDHSPELPRVIAVIAAERVFERL